MKRLPHNPVAAPASTIGSPTPAPPVTAPAASDTSRQVQTVSYDFHTDKWAEAYGKRIDEMIAALKANGVPVLWIGLPAIRGPRTMATSLTLMSFIGSERRKRGSLMPISGTASSMIRDSTQCRVPDFEGQICRLRSSDGVHFTKYGAEKLAHYIEHDVRRALKRDILVAVPGSDAPKPKVPEHERP